MHTENEHIDDSFLNLLGNKGGFEVDENYFNKLRKDILNKTVYQGFAVPDGYFDSLSTRILDKTQDKKGFLFHLRPYAKWTIAACFFLVSGLLFRFYNSNHQDGYILEMNKLSDEEIVNYMDANDIQDASLFEASIHIDDKTSREAEKYLSDQNLNEEL